MTTDPTLSIVVPVYNERATLLELLSRVAATPYRKEIILVDDCSTDGTTAIVQDIEKDWSTVVGVADAEAIERTAVRCFYQTENQGKGAALARGFKEVRGDLVVIQDADLEYDPSDYSRLLEPILAGDADVVYGSRFAGSNRRVLYFWHALGNRFLTLLSNMTTNLNLTDMETCYKMFRADLLPRFSIKSARFGIEPEITAKFAHMRVRIYEVPISYKGRSYESGKKITWKDGVSALWAILKYAYIDDVDNELPGYTTLQRMAKLRAYNRWMWSKLEAYVGDSILEVGSGTGNVTQFLTSRAHVTATDVDEMYLSTLKTVFASHPNVGVCRMDLGEDPPPEISAREYDTVICLNVLEHIEDDAKALRNLYSLLVPGGRLLLVVPALEALHGSIDEAIGHYRRYTRETMGDAAQAAGFLVENLHYFNTIGIPGWYLNSKILKRRTVPGIQARVNNLLTPLLKLEDHFTLPWGMSLVCIAERPLNGTAAPSAGEHS